MPTDPLDYVSPEARAKLLEERQRLADLDATTRDVYEPLSEAQCRRAQWESMQRLRAEAAARKADAE